MVGLFVAASLALSLPLKLAVTAVNASSQPFCATSQPTGRVFLLSVSGPSLNCWSHSVLIQVRC